MKYIDFFNNALYKCLFLYMFFSRTKYNKLNHNKVSYVNNKEQTETEPNETQEKVIVNDIELNKDDYPFEIGDTNE